MSANIYSCLVHLFIICYLFNAFKKKWLFKMWTMYFTVGASSQCYYDKLMQLVWANAIKMPDQHKKE